MTFSGHSYTGINVYGDSRVHNGDQYNIAAETKEEKILHWLSPLNPWTRHKEARDQRQEGTLRWFFEHPTLQSWLNGEVKRIWCPGISMREAFDDSRLR